MSLAVRLRHRRGDFTLDLAFDADADGVIAICGHSGAGKSTLLAALAGLLRPEQGRISVAGTTLLDTDTGIDVSVRARRLGMVFQSPRLFPHMDVRANLLFGHARQQHPAPAADIAAIIEVLGIGPLLHRRPATLSGGEAQRVAIGRALLTTPRMLLLDEPLAALDPARREEVMSCLERVRASQRVPMLYVTHRHEEIARLADHVVMIEQGRLLHSGPVESALASVGSDDAGTEAPMTVIRGTVSGHDERFGLTDVTCAAGHLAVARLAADTGADIRLGIRATDITLTLDKPGRTSANNVLESRVTSLRDVGASWTDVRLDCAGQTLLARITRRSVQRLALTPGDRAWALVKSTTLSR